MKTERKLFKVAVFIFVRDGSKILLIRRYNTGWKDGEYTLPSGHVEEGESIFKAATRECFEETGLAVNETDLRVVHTMRIYEKPNDYIYIFLESNRFSGTPKVMETQKCDDVKWFDVNLLPVNLVSHVSQAFDCIRNTIIFSEANE